MDGRSQALVWGTVIAALLSADMNWGAARLDLVREAQAIVGAPMTPISYAGVARRTTRRVVAVEATEATAAATAAAAAPKPTPIAVVPAPPVAAPPPAAAAAPAGAPAMGMIVASLPPGCKPTAIGGVEYYYCSGVFYRTAFQGGNLVYVVTQP